MMSRAFVLAALAACMACGANFESDGGGSGAGATGISGTSGAGGKGASSGGASSGGASSGGVSSGGASSGGASGGVSSGGGGGSAGTSMPGGGSDSGGSSNGGAPGCGDIGSACVNDCPDGLECNGGLCVPSQRGFCGGFNPMECPDTQPNCLYCTGCDFGDCFTDAELACLCAAPNVGDVYTGCP